ncbi:MAG: DUF4998 domain-containing protein [Prevotellaceae bacterium]|nr:DUF4998 domain-containing protein [Prevotellaceae bacterium]
MQISGLLAEIQWYGAPDDFFCSEIRYTDINSNTAIVRTFPNEMQTSCPNIKVGTEIETRSLYLPNNSIDTFYVEWERIVPVVRFNKSGWSIVAFSDQREDDGGGVNSLIDDNLDNYWHSQWGPNAPLPLIWQSRKQLQKSILTDGAATPTAKR